MKSGIVVVYREAENETEIERERERERERGTTRATMAKNERRVKRMAVESWPCRGGDRGEAAVRCCESMAVEIFYFLF